MSHVFEGTLSVKAINGSRGRFCVGDLVTDVGEFRIKDTMLDEFESGQYKGRFVVSSIFPATRTWRGNVYVEVRARLDAIHLDEVSETPEPAAEQGSEPDPIDEPSQQKLAPESPAEADAKPDSSSTEQAEPELFDSELLRLIEQGGPVKLDPNGIDRATFRAQRDALKEMGFRFLPASQQWVLDQ